MNLFRTLAVCLALALPAQAGATTFATDATDVWTVGPSEAGWGLNIVQQDDTLFASLFVYGPDNRPTWYFSSSLAYVGTTSTGGLVYSGDLLATTGSWFALPFNLGEFGFRKAGSATFTLEQINQAKFTYTVDNVAVEKTLSRYTFRYNPLGGSYMGGIVGTYSQCTTSTFNGYAEQVGAVDMTHSGSQFSMKFSEQGGGSCTFTGSYMQQGKHGAASGNFTCTGGETGTFQFNEIEANLQGLYGRGDIRGTVCNWLGRFGGVRRG